MSDVNKLNRNRKRNIRVNELCGRRADRRLQRRSIFEITFDCVRKIEFRFSLFVAFYSRAALSSINDQRCDAASRSSSRRSLCDRCARNSSFGSNYDDFEILRMILRMRVRKRKSTRNDGIRRVPLVVAEPLEEKHRWIVESKYKSKTKNLCWFSRWLLLLLICFSINRLLLWWSDCREWLQNSQCFQYLLNLHSNIAIESNWSSKKLTIVSSLFTSLLLLLLLFS